MIQYQFNKDAKKPKKADVYIYDIIGDSWDGTTARQFAQDLAALGLVDELNLFINSPGGVVNDGIAIYNTLIRHKAQKTAYIDGAAASIASVIPLAADKIITMKNASWMIHNPYTWAVGESDELRRAADRLDMLRGTILAAYVERSNGKATEKQFNAWMNEEKWFSAQEALAAGLTDEVSDKEVAVAACATLAKFDFTKFKNVPKSLLELQATAKAQSSTNRGAGSVERRPDPRLVRSKARVLKIAARRTA